MTFDMTNEQWNEFAANLDATLSEIIARLESAEAWICRRPNDAIPQVIIDQLQQEAVANYIASQVAATPPEEVENAADNSPDLPNRE